MISLVATSPLPRYAQGNDERARTRYENKKISERSRNFYDYATIRAKNRMLYRNSDLIRGIAGRLCDLVIHTGLDLQYSPVWSMLPIAPTDDEDRYEYTKQVETYWRLITKSTDLDIEKLFTFSELQRHFFKNTFSDGELILVYRYSQDPRRLTPVSLQRINPDQLCTPWGAELQAVRNAGGDIVEGVEVDSEGERIAIWVNGKNYKPTRIAFFGTKSNRRFVSYYANTDAVGQVRGISEIDGLAYRIDRLDEYNVAELEAAVNGGALLGAVEAQKDTMPGKGNLFKATGSVTNSITGDAPKPGNEVVELGGKSLLIQNMYPGYSMKMFQPTRPNPNYVDFVESQESGVTGSFGLSYGSYRLSFDASYSAARMESIFQWLNIDVRRDGFFRILNEIFEAVFSEAILAGVLKAPGFFTSPVVRRAYLNSAWNGVPRPSVDPEKEVRAVRERLDLFHTTNEREAEIHNGSDYRENVERQKSERALASTLKSPVSTVPGTNEETPSEPGTPDDGAASALSGPGYKRRREARASKKSPSRRSA